MSKRDRALSNGHQIKDRLDFSKTGYMYTNDFFNKRLPSEKKNDSSVGFQAKERSLNNSALDYQQKSKEEPINNAQTTQYSTAKAERRAKRSFLQPKAARANLTFLQNRNTYSDFKDGDKFQKTTNKLVDINFKHHDNDNCVCQQCHCGRHLCKLHVVKPDVHVNTIYRKDFNAKTPLDQLSHRPSSSKRPNANGPNLDIRTIYGKDFKQKNVEIERPHPEDLLGVGGPAANLTSYSAGFPGYKCENQYVKPTFNANNNGLMPFQGNSIYQQSFSNKGGRPQDIAKWNNHFKVGEPWLGNTTYRENFKQPASDKYPKIQHIEEKLEHNPDFPHQYQTIYKNDFLKTNPMVCKAKITLESKKKGEFNQSRMNFNENADFKAMNPHYHAISTSKHSYV